MSLFAMLLPDGFYKWSWLSWKNNSNPNDVQRMGFLMPCIQLVVVLRHSWIAGDKKWYHEMAFRQKYMTFYVIAQHHIGRDWNLFLIVPILHKPAAFRWNMIIWSTYNAAHATIGKSSWQERSCNLILDIRVRIRTNDHVCVNGIWCFVAHQDMQFRIWSIIDCAMITII